MEKIAAEASEVMSLLAFIFPIFSDIFRHFSGNQNNM